jgi:pyruvate/2-oxoglutarate dehydrogenase complex dihydrolipoamide dehydrogenase (E3) component
VIVIGSTIIGCELAEFLTKRRRKVTIVHMDDELGAGMIKDDRLRLIPWLEKKGTTIFTGATYHEITEQGLVITTREGKKKTLEADTIVVALPLLPDTNTTKSLEGKARETYTIGDSREPQMMPQAVADGARIGFMI